MKRVGIFWKWKRIFTFYFIIWREQLK